MDITVRLKDPSPVILDIDHLPGWAFFISDLLHIYWNMRVGCTFSLDCVGESCCNLGKGRMKLRF